MRLNQRGGVQDYYDMGNRLNFTTAEDYENWFKRVQGYTQNVKNSLKNNMEGWSMGTHSQTCDSWSDGAN